MSAGNGTPHDPELDEILAVMPVGFREMMGRMQSWTTRLVLAYADGQGEQVNALHTQISQWRRPIWDGAADMPQWQSALRQAADTFEALRSLSTRSALTSASNRQIGDGAAQMIRDHGPAVHTDRILAAAADYATDKATTAFQDLAEQEADEAAALFYCAGAGWLFNRVFLAREAGRMSLMGKIRQGEQIALGVPTPEWATDIPDTAAFHLLRDVLDLEPALLPPRDPHRRNLLEHDLVATAKLHLLEHPTPTEAERAALRQELLTMITSFRMPGDGPENTKRPPHQPSATAHTTPKPGQRPNRRRR